MAFKASKKRERKAPEPVGKGTALIPSAAIESWYRKRLEAMSTAMVKDYKEQINNTLDHAAVQEFFATDAAATSAFKKVMEKLDQKWSDVFRGFAKSTSKEFVDKSDEHATATTRWSLSTAGIEQPRAAYNENIANTLTASQDFNNTLIAGIQEDVHEKIYTAVMLSLTSPDPEKQGQSGIEAALREIGGFAKNRAKLIAQDQTSKLYSSLSDQRMEENGVDEFEWMHSSAGKVPRHTHVEKDGMIFKLNDPRLWEGPKADQGPPGWAIRCRCRKIPVIR